VGHEVGVIDDAGSLPPIIEANWSGLVALPRYIKRCDGPVVTAYDRSHKVETVMEPEAVRTNP
jgi:hypothetical protein